MFAWVNNIILMIGMVLAGFGLLVAPALFDQVYASIALASGVIGAVMIIVGIGIGYGSAEWWSRFALGIGTWSMVAPLVLGFHHDAAAFWTHVVAGFVALFIGVAGHELTVNTADVTDRASSEAANSR